jgi:hypothetical protein
MSTVPPRRVNTNVVGTTSARLHDGVSWGEALACDRGNDAYDQVSDDLFFNDTDIIVAPPGVKYRWFFGS